MKIPFFEFKRSRAKSTHVQQLPAAKTMEMSYLSLCREGFLNNVVVYQSIMRIASAVGSMRWTVYDAEGNRLKTHPYLKLIQRPNPLQSSQEWWRAKIAYLLLTGDNFDERILNSAGIPSELWTHRPDRFKINPAENRMHASYTYNENGAKTVFQSNAVTGISDIRHTRLFNPLDDFYGQTPIKPAALAVDQHNAAMQWIVALLQNSATPSGTLTVDKEITLGADAFARLKAEIETVFSGAKNAGRPMLLEGGLTWQSMSFSPADMEIIAQKDSAARDIALAWGVPPLLLNIPGDNTYSNYREARLGFYEDTVIPLVDLVTAELNDWLSPVFDGATISPDYDSIEAITEKRRGLWSMVDSSDEITVDEARILKGFPALGGERGEMLMADLRATRRGHTSDRANAEDALKEEIEG